MLKFNYCWIPVLIIITLSKDFAAAAFEDSRNVSPATVKLLLPSAKIPISACPGLNPALNYRPVIGILSHPGDGASGRLSNATNGSYIAASYVKFVESAGARVIPLIYNESPDVLEEKLSLVNGVVFTGGWARRGLYIDVLSAVFKKALQRNDAGEHFPLIAINLGFENLVKIISKNNNILERFSPPRQAWTLQFVENINLEGTVFQRFPSDLLTKLSTACIVLYTNNHGISPETLRGNADLSGFFKILTTTTDIHGKVFVSTVQGNSYPVIGLQWDPEKNAFEWGSSRIPHVEDAVRVTQNVANFFVSEARKSSNRPPARKVLDNLIYNYSPTYSGKDGHGYDEVYLFS